MNAKYLNTNNLTYYNLPIKLNTQPSPPPSPPPRVLLESKTNVIEKFEDEKAKSACAEPACDSYVKHILECSRCKSIAIKQLGIENDRIRNEEIMEVISYIIFGLFILLLIDSLKEK